MPTAPKPGTRPQSPHFSSGPCAKFPGWKPEMLASALLGRSHRSTQGKARLKRAIDPISVNQTPPGPEDTDVPHVTRLVVLGFQFDGLHRRGGVHMIEQQQPYPRGMPGEK